MVVLTLIHCAALQSSPEGNSSPQDQDSRALFAARRVQGLAASLLSTFRRSSQVQKYHALFSTRRVQGLIPRATELLKLGGVFVLSFGPAIAGTAIVFALIYSVGPASCYRALLFTHTCFDMTTSPAP
jgi:hypothetical protein